MWWLVALLLLLCFSALDMIVKLRPTEPAADPPPIGPILVFESRTSSANGAFGRHERHDSAGIRLVTGASR
jgi:hypothetical protein